MTAHLGNIMTIKLCVCGKFVDMKEEVRILKGHIVFRDDVVRDHNGTPEVF